MRIRLADLACIVGLLWGSFPTSHAELPPEPPNVLVIMADDLGYGDLSAYGATDLESPHIDGLIASGMRLDRFYANCPVCSPTRAALLTGRYPDRAGVPGVIRTQARNNWGYLDTRVPLLSDTLRSGGYHPAIVGKWHLGLTSPNTPTERGFLHFHGFLGDMMDDYHHHLRHGNNYMRLNGRTLEPEGHATDLFTRWAVDYLDARRGDGQRFFLFLSYNAPHTPIQPPEDWFRRVREREPGITEQRARLVALIEHMDHGIGQVLEALERNGQRNDTLVVFTSDNGGQLNVGGHCGNLRGGKQDMYEGGIRVPFCASWPGVIPANSRSSSIGITMDLHPTICEIAGMAPPDGLDGISLVPTLLDGSRPGPDRSLVWVRREGGMRYRGQDYYAYRKGPWKLVQNTPFETFELYHLDDDPMETTDLAEEQPRLYRRLNSELMLHIQTAGSIPWQAPPDHLTDSPDPRR